LCILTFIIIISFTQFSISNFSPFFIEGAGFSGILKASTLLYYGFLGFDIMTIIAEEGKDPVRDVPRAVIQSILYVGFIYILVSFSINGVGKM
jgi:APA family basic amino acid/polyamine antiporter